MSEEKNKRSSEIQKKLINRLSRIEGQIRGLKNMIENDAYCVDILTQSNAASSALNAFNRELLGTHIRTCVSNDILKGNTEKTEELIELLKKLM